MFADVTNGGQGDAHSLLKNPKKTPSVFNRFRRNKKGSAAVEFALISIPFFGLIFAIIETAMVFWCGQVLETAVATVSRNVFTGTIATSLGTVPTGTDAEKFKTLICQQIPGLFDCAGLVKVDVKSFDSFQTVALPALTNAGEINAGGFGYAPGTGGKIVIVRAAMGYPVYTGFMNNNASLSGRRNLIVASAAFRNEPF
jgi:Flp pilus assembly protein TadG